MMRRNNWIEDHGWDGESVRAKQRTRARRWKDCYAGGSGKIPGRAVDLWQNVIGATSGPIHIDSISTVLMTQFNYLGA